MPRRTHRSVPVRYPRALAALARSRLRRFGVALVCAYVALVPLVFDASTDWPFIVPKALVGHAIAYAMLAVLAALVVRFGRAALPRSPLHAPVLAYLAAAALATVFAADRYIGLFGTHDRMLGLATIAGWVLLYFAVVAFVRTRSDVNDVAISMFGAAALVLLYELVQVTGQDPFHWSMAGALRAFSTIGQPNSLGQYASTLAVGAFSLGLLAPGIRTETRGLLVLLAAALVWGAAATDSRAPVAGLVAAAVVFVTTLLVSRRGARDRRIALFAGAVTAVALLALALLTPIGERVRQTIQATGARDGTVFSLVDESTATRLALYQIGLGELLERPLLGYGPDNFVVGVGRYRPPAAPFEVRQSAASSAHSWVVQVATSTGLLGLLALLACFATAAALVLRSGAAPLALVAATTLVAFLGTGLATVDDLAAGWIPWLCLGAIAAATVREGEPAARTAPPSRRKRRAADEPSESRVRPVVAAMLVALGVVAMITPLTAYSASRDAKTSGDALILGKPSAAVSPARAAVQSDPGRGEYWHALGAAYLANQRPTDARAAFQRANDLTPYLGDYTVDLISVERALGQAGDATALARAVALADALVVRDANNPRSQVSRAVTMQAAGNIPEAVGSIERALVLDPGSRYLELYLSAAQIYLAAGRARDAVDVARRGVAAMGGDPGLPVLHDALDAALARLGLPPDPR